MLVVLSELLKLFYYGQFKLFSLPERQEEQAKCQILLSLNVFIRTGWEKHQILSDLICLVQCQQADGL